MADRLIEEDREALFGFSPIPSTNKINHSYSQQLRTPSVDKRPFHQGSKNSLDRISKDRFDNDFTDDELFNRAASMAATSTSTAGPGDEYTVFSRVDQNLCTDDGAEEGRESQPMAEFIGSGGGVGMFKVPIRAAVHPGRPPCLELRPHPLRETQVGRFLRNIACTETQLWAGQENGIRFWRFVDSYEPGLQAKVKRGDEDAAPFHESANTSPTLCLLVDNGKRLVWSGHKDGKIRSWRMDQPADDETPFKEGLSWQAHRGPVTSVIMSSYGKLSAGLPGN